MKLNKRNHFFILLALAGLLISLTTAISYASETPKEIVLTTDTSTITVETYSDTVGDLLNERAIIVTGKDFVSPSQAAPLEDEDIVTVVFGKNITLTVGQHGPKEKKVAAITVGDALEKLSVALDNDDTVKPAPDTYLKEGSHIVVNRVSFKRIVKKHSVHYKTETKKTNKLYKGVKKTKRAGKKGQMKVFYERKRVNGKTIYTRKIDEKLVKKPQTKIVLVGTKPRPENTLTGVWRALAQCESGLNPKAVGGGGSYYGLFQFSLGTWQSVGGTGLPTNASISEQVKRAKILQARSGWGQWPYCSSKLGLH